jgi:HlyD family secretion protein
MEKTTPNKLPSARGRLLHIEKIIGAVLAGLVLALLPACKPEASLMTGYVEGEYLYIAPTTGGILKTLSVSRGQPVDAGQALFALDNANLQSALLSARAEVAQARARWNDLTKGQRQEEIDIILKQQEQALAALRNAEKEFNRVQKLVRSGTVSRSIFDDRKAKNDVARARVEELSARLKAATLGAREDEIAAAGAAVEIAEQHVIQAEKQLQEAAPVAPLAGRIENTFFNAGEFVPAGTPVISFLPPQNIKIRFFVPQARVPSFPPGTPVRVFCDGCTGPIPAKITYIASQAEFTPPVIYSVKARDKLVFMMEATPDHFEPDLRPGLPVDIVPAAP